MNTQQILLVISILRAGIGLAEKVLRFLLRRRELSGLRESIDADVKELKLRAVQIEQKIKEANSNGK